MIAPSRDIDLDAGPRAQELERMCVATRTVRPVADMIRFVIGPDGEAVPDLKRKLPGRGVWVTATQDALSDAVKRKALARGFKREVRLPADLVARTGAAARTCRPRCARHGGQSRPGRNRIHQGRGGFGPGEGCRPPPCGRGRCRRRPQARCGAEAPAGARSDRNDRHFDLGAIGFGIGAPKCDTCSPACRPPERHVFGAFAAPGAVSQRRAKPAREIDAFRNGYE